MEIYLDRRSIRQIRQSAADAIEDGDTETLREDLMQAFNDDEVERIERHLDGGDLVDFLTDAIEEWDGEDVDELFEVLETHLSDVGVELKYRHPDNDDDSEDAEDDDTEDDDDDDEFSEDEDDDLDLPDDDI